MEEELGEATHESEAARLSQHSGPPAEEWEGDPENDLVDEDGVSDDEEEGVSDDEDADGGAEDAQEDAVLAEELVEGEQQSHEAGPAVEENGMQNGDDTVLLMFMEHDPQ